jgi:flagellar hook-associated protein 2
MSTPLDGLASGLGTTDLINQLIQLERQPQQRLAVKRQTAATIVQSLQGLNTKLSTLRTAGRALGSAAQWGSMKASSSSDAVATASATTAALGGSLSFTVAALARAGGLASSGTVSTASAVVATSPLLIATGTKPLGIHSVKAGAALTVGEHEIDVIQETSGATKTATLSPLAASTIINGANDEINLTINGQATTITLDAGTYTAAELAAHVQSKSSGALTASLSGTGHLELTTVAEGSAATLQITGGDALVALGLTTDGAAITGGDGQIEVNGVGATVSDARSGATQNVLSDDGGTITITYAGGIRSGAATAHAIDVGIGSLSATASAINAAKKGVSAAVVQVSPGAFRLQLTATATGVAADLGVAADAFTGLGTMATTTAAADARITIGSGAGAYDVTGSSNSLSVLPGTTVTVKTLGAATISVDRDGGKLAAMVQGTVEQANAILADIKAATAFNATTKTGGLLMGNFAVRNIQQNLVNAVISAVGADSLGSASLAGVSLTKEGKLEFNKAVFDAAFAADPDKVAAVFKQNGIASNSGVSFVSATDKTAAGTYAVAITVPGTQASMTGLTAPALETIAANETIDVRIGSTIATYNAQAGDTLTEVADGLNAAITAKGLDVTATVEAGRLVLRSVGYGTAAEFDVRSSRDDGDVDQTGIVDVAGAWESKVGVDVVGTINGVAAVGKGQRLTAPGDDADLAGMQLLITATAAGALGTLEYVPGVGQRIATAANRAVDSVSGSLTAVIEGRQSEIERLGDQIERWEVRIEARERALRKRFTAMEMALQRSQGQSQWLQGQIAGMQANSARR